MRYPEEASYGLDRKLQVIFIQHIKKNFITLDPSYSAYSNLDEYIYSASVRAINLAFSVGFTIKGKKLKTQS